MFITNAFATNATAQTRAQYKPSTNANTPTYVDTNTRSAPALTGGANDMIRLHTYVGMY